MTHYAITTKLQLKATRWEKDGDHPNVTNIPDHVNVEGVPRENLRMLSTGDGQNTVFVMQPVWIIQYTTGQLQLVDDNHFNESYNIVNEIQE